MIERDPEKAVLDKYIQDATVLFLDIQGFTTLVQEHPPEKINHVIESYFSAFFEVIQKHGGDVNETAGDGMMVIFLDQEPMQHARNTVQAALNIQTKCQLLQKEKGSELFPITVKIGISSGEVYLGSTKMRGIEDSRWTFTASGPVTILAARLSEYGRGGQILVGEETARRLGSAFRVSRLGKLPLKNIEDSGEVFEIRDIDNPQPGVS
ncbi:MAG: adenylate/guanylate cyclase domain-containing protein [Deltaproteobacteria bacterium]|nr:adenylate/guanylate cyclase domain-containing protein [Deltaproteobacteria bacterium]